MKLTSMRSLAEALPNNSPNYKGLLPKYQLLGKSVNGKKYQHIKQLNAYQTLLYKRALYGLNMYTPEEQKAMHWERKRRISRVSIKAQKSINLFKQECVNNVCDAIYKGMYPDGASEGMQALLCSEKMPAHPKFINTLDLKTLGITKECIIDRFINEGILPKNFYELTKAA